MNLKLPKAFLLLMLVSFLISCKEEEKKALPPVKVPFITVENKDAPIYKDFAAQTFGDLDIVLTARVEGILTGIHFKEGQKVKKGQLLYTIDPLEYDTKVDQVRGQVASYESAQVNADAELKRIRPLAEMNAVSKRELDAAEAKADAARYNVQSIKANLRNQQLERSYCNIYAPVDGVIGISNARVGDYITKIGPSSKLNTVSKLDHVRVRFAVSEAGYLQFQKINRSLDEYTDLELLLSDGSVYPHHGKINFSDASIDPATGTITFEAQFPNPEGTLRSGQFSKVRIKVNTEKNAVVIPQKAITEMQGIYQVNAITQDNKLEVRVVEVGSKVGSDWVISKGLKAGDRVAIIGSLFIQPGSTVDPVPYVADDVKVTAISTK